MGSRSEFFADVPVVCNEIAGNLLYDENTATIWEVRVMFEPNRCPGCGATLPSDAPAGLCPLCLLRHGLGCEEPEPSREGDFQGDGDGGAVVPLDFAREMVRLPRALFDDAEPGEISGPALGCDRYQILGEIARGGMGAILKGRPRARSRPRHQGLTR